MSNVGDALSGGGSSASGISDTTLSDASLGDQLAGGTGDFGTGTGASAFGGGNSFSSFNDIANAFSGGGAGVGATPTAVQSASMTPPAAAGQTGGDPTGAAGGTQSNTAPGSTPTDQNQQQQTGGKQQQNPDYAPPSAVAQLKSLLKQLNTGKPPGPTGPVPQGGQNTPFALPTLAAGQTGPQSPSLFGGNPAVARLEGGAPEMGPGFPGSQPGGSADIPADLPSDKELKFDPQTGTYSLPPGGVSIDAQGNPLTAAGTRADQTPLPPPRPPQTTQVSSLGGDPAGDQTEFGGGEGRDITVRKPGAGATPTANLPTRVPPGSAAAPLPTKKPGASPAPEQTPIPQPSRIMQDITGVSTGSPTALVDLARAIMPMLPLLAGLFGGGGRRGGHFHGGRFTHGFGGGLSGFRGGMNAMGHLHGGQHPMAPGAWPYHHEMHGWHMHPRHPGPGWLPLNPMDAQGIVGGGGSSGGGGASGGWDANNPPKETDTPFTGETEPPSGKGPWDGNPFLSALVGAESGGHQGPGVRGDRGLATGYYQIQTPTWGDFAPRVPGAGGYKKAEDAPANIQQAVASIIPVARFGDRTRNMLHAQFGQFDERMTVGQLSERFATRSAVSGKPRSVSTAATIPTTLPVTSQPMVSGG
jgi:hypothetical protein